MAERTLLYIKYLSTAYFIFVFGPCQQAGQNMMLFTSVCYDYIYSTEDIIWLV